MRPTRAPSSDLLERSAPRHGDDRGSDARDSWASGWISRVVVFHLVCLAWVFFRAQSVDAALAMLTWLPEFLTAFQFLAFFIVPMLVIDLINERGWDEYLLERAPHPARIAVALSLLFAVTLFSGNNVNAFIYFQF